MSPTLLVPLDGSPLAARALPWAAAWARRSAGRLVLLRVLSPPATLKEPLVQEPMARAELETAADKLRLGGHTVVTDLDAALGGSVASTIVAAARRHLADAIVLSTHGRGGLGRWLYGSVADAVLRRAPVPVLLVPPDAMAIWPSEGPLRMVVALDGSALAEQALGPIAAAAATLSAELVLLRVVPPPSSEAALYLYESQEADTQAASQALVAAADRLRAEGLTVTTRTTVGAPSAGIVATAQELGAHLVAMATHGRTGLARLVLGSVATETLQRASTPLLLVRPAGLRETEAVPTADAPTVEPLAPARLTLLVAVDPHHEAAAAIAAAGTLARASNARLVLLNVFNPWVDLGHVLALTQDERLTYARAERTLYLRRLAAQLDGIEVRTWVEAQRRREERDACIARVAAEVQADFVILASQSVASPVGGQLGSTAQGVLRLSPCPVIVVRPGMSSLAGPARAGAEPAPPAITAEAFTVR